MDPESIEERLYQALEGALSTESHTAPSRVILRPGEPTVHRDLWLPLEVEQDLPAFVLGPAPEEAERVSPESFGNGAPDTHTVERRIRFVVEIRVAGTHRDLAPFRTWARSAVRLAPDVAALVRDLQELGTEYRGAYVEEPLAAAQIFFEATFETLAVDDTAAP